MIIVGIERKTLDREGLDILRKINANYEGHDVYVIPIDEGFDPIGVWVKENVTIRIVIAGKTRKSI